MQKNKSVKKREIDRMVEGAYGWLGDSFVLIQKKTVKTWQGVFIIAFVAGAFAALIWSVSMDIQLRTFAVGETASLKISPANITVAQGGNFSVDVVLNTGGKSVVATRAIVNYDTNDFSLVDWNTTGSAFSSGNSCVYDNKPCEIVTNDVANGKISIVLAKPAPGVNVSAGKIATLNFRATNNAQADNIFITFEGVGKYTDSDVIMDGIGASGAGTDILASVTNANIQISVPVVACTDFTYSEWSACQNGTQNRVVTSSLPAGCTGGDPVLSQACQQPVCADFTYSEWSACQDGTQTRTVATTSPADCAGGEPVLSQSCQVTCTEFTYSEWGECQKNKTQIRTVLTSLPTGCTGGTPILKQACVVVKDPTTPPAKGKNK